MSQPCYVMAFRKRLKSFGYTNVSIVFSHGFYVVSAIEPLSSISVHVRLSPDEIYLMFR